MKPAIDFPHNSFFYILGFFSFIFCFQIVFFFCVFLIIFTFFIVCYSIHFLIFCLILMHCACLLASSRFGTLQIVLFIYVKYKGIEIHVL